jgi:hypothetical protein
MPRLSFHLSSASFSERQPALLVAAVSLARIEQCSRADEAAARPFRPGNRRHPRLDARTGHECLLASAEQNRHVARQAMGALGALLRTRGLDPIDVTAALRDAVRLVLQLSASIHSVAAEALERDAVQWGIDGYNAAAA